MGGRRGQATRVGARRRRALHEAAQPPQVVEDLIQAMPLDELHGIVVHPLMLSHAVYRHDVAVVQPRRRAGLELKSLELGRTEPPIHEQDLERDVPAQRLLHRLVDDSHSAPADLAEQPVVAQAPIG